MSQSIHPGTDVGVVALRVSDLQRSIQFYDEIVGLRTLRVTESTAELGVEGSDQPLVVLEALASGSVTPRRRTAGLYHFAILLPDRPSLGKALRKLMNAGIEIGQGDHWVSEALYISDPDQNGIEIYRDRPREEWPRGTCGGIRMGTDPIDWEGLLAEAGGETMGAMPAGTKMGHVHLHVSNLEEAHRFYCGILGFELIINYGGSALFVSAGGYHHHLGLNTWAGVGAPPAPETEPGLSYYTVTFPNRPALEAVLSSLRASEIEVSASPAGEAEAWFVRDPSGNRIRLVIA